MRGEKSTGINDVPRFVSQGILANLVNLQRSLAEWHWHYNHSFSNQRSDLRQHQHPPSNEKELRALIVCHSIITTLLHALGMSSFFSIFPPSAPKGKGRGNGTFYEFVKLGKTSMSRRCGLSSLFRWVSQCVFHASLFGFAKQVLDRMDLVRLSKEQK
jgi:hypothetical protein